MPIRTVEGNKGSQSFVVRARRVEKALKQARHNAGGKRARLHRRNACLNDEDITITRVRRDGSLWADDEAGNVLTVTN